MKIAVLSDSWVSKKIQQAFADENAEIIDIGKAENVQNIQNCVDLSLAIVDIGVMDADARYEQLKKSCNVPIVIALDNTTENWRRMLKIDADGFILRNSGPLEITARINAIRNR